MQFWHALNEHLQNFDFFKAMYDFELMLYSDRLITYIRKSIASEQSISSKIFVNLISFFFIIAALAFNNSIALKSFHRCYVERTYFIIFHDDTHFEKGAVELIKYLCFQNSMNNKKKFKFKNFRLVFHANKDVFCKLKLRLRCWRHKPHVYRN